jgi:hypothetical protein
VIVEELDQLLWTGCFPRLAGDLELNSGASGGLHHRRGELTGAWVSGGDEKSFGEEEVRDLGFLPSGGSPIYKPRRAAVFILGVGVTAADRALPSAPPSCLSSRG